MRRLLPDANKAMLRTPYRSGVLRRTVHSLPEHVLFLTKCPPIYPKIRPRRANEKSRSCNSGSFGHLENRGDKTPIELFVVGAPTCTSPSNLPCDISARRTPAVRESRPERRPSLPIAQAPSPAPCGGRTRRLGSAATRTERRPRAGRAAALPPPQSELPHRSTVPGPTGRSPACAARLERVPRHRRSRRSRPAG